MNLFFDSDLIGCKDLANDRYGEKVRHFVSLGDKNAPHHRLSEPRCAEMEGHFATRLRKERSTFAA